MLSAISKKVIFMNNAKSALLSSEDVVDKILKVADNCECLRDPKDPIIQYYKTFIQYQINNVGDPFSSSKLFNHTKDFEVEIIKHFGSLYLLEDNNIGGYVDLGFPRSELYIMNIILNRFDDLPIFLVPQEAVDNVISLSKVFDVPRDQIKFVKSDSNTNGMDLNILRTMIKGIDEGSPIVLWLSLGDNNGVVDNLNEVKKVLNGRRNVHIHYSCSSLGVIVPYLKNDLGINFKNGMDSIAIPLSGFFGVPIKGGVAITKLSYANKAVLNYDETQEKDSTLAGSRIGHLQLLLWVALKARAEQGIKEEIARVQKNTSYLKKTLEMNRATVEVDEFKSAIFFETYSTKLITDWDLKKIIGSKNTYKFNVHPYFTKSKLDSFIEQFLNTSPKNKVVSIDELPDEVQKIYTLPEADQIRLHNLKQHFNSSEEYFIGFPCNLKFANQVLKDILKIFEYDLTLKSVAGLREDIIDYLIGTLRIPKDELYVAITTGGSLSNLLGCLVPRIYFNGSVGYVSKDAHYSIVKVSNAIRMECVVIKSQNLGELDYEDLEKQIIAHQPKPVVISLNIGSTMQGAIDNIVKVKNIFKKLKITRYHIHCDAALDGGYLQLINDAPHHGFDMGIDSLAISLHKYLGSPIPCSLFLTRKSLLTPESKEIIEKVFSVQDGIITALIWYAINHQRTLTPGAEAKQLLEKADYLLNKLKEISINSWKNEYSNIVCFSKPSNEVIYKWKLCTMEGFSHVVVMQHVSYDMLNEFIGDMQIESSKILQFV